MIDLKEVFDKHEGEHLQFELIENPPHHRPDICAFIIIDRLLPNPGRDMVTSAEHDQIWLDADCEKLAEVATEDDVIALLRCGVWYDSETDSLSTFV